MAKYLQFSTVLLLTLHLAGCARADATPVAPLQDGREVVVLVHGLGRSGAAMWRMAAAIEAAGFAVARLDYDSLRETPEDIVAEVSAQIERCCVGLPGTVHFVGHSLGGLLIRAYLGDHRLPNLGRVVLVGTPNRGTPLVDHYRGEWWFQMAGVTALALGTGAGSFPSRLPPPYYPVGVIAGASGWVDNEEIIPGQDDGLVPVESTRLDGMTDFILLDTSHAKMRYSEEVFEQIVHFLRHGKFRR